MDICDTAPRAAINRLDATPREAIDIAKEEEEGNNPPLLAPPLLDRTVAEVADLSHVKGILLLHHHIKQKKAVFLSLYLETGGEECGII